MIVSVMKCDDPTCGATIEENSTTRVDIVGSFTLTVHKNGTSGSKLTRLDFCNKNCLKKYIDDL